MSRLRPRDASSDFGFARGGGDGSWREMSIKRGVGDSPSTSSCSYVTVSLIKMLSIKWLRLWS